jgi:phosphate transport system substrate-binding protein
MRQAGVVLTITALIGIQQTATAQDKIVTADGSSTVAPVTDAVAEEFQNAVRNAVHVTVGTSGTGGGFKKFCRGEIDVANASRPISESEMKAAKDARSGAPSEPASFNGRQYRS